MVCEWKDDFREYIAEGRKIAPSIDGGWFGQRMQAALDEVAALEGVLVAAREMNRLLWLPHEPRDLMIKRRALNVALELYDTAMKESDDGA
jgi:hypothetical protein